jgi:hypothetical protein
LHHGFDDILDDMKVAPLMGHPAKDLGEGGGVLGVSAWGALACLQASQGGLVVRAAKGVGSRWRFGFGGVGADGGGHVAGSLGHAQWSMRHSHTKAISVSWE